MALGAKPFGLCAGQSHFIRSITADGLNLKSSVESTAVGYCTESHAFFHYFKLTRRVTTRSLKITKEIPDIQHIRRPRYDSTEDIRLKNAHGTTGQSTTSGRLPDGPVIGQDAGYVTI
jgi:hypothetical protein